MHKLDAAAACSSCDARCGSHCNRALHACMRQPGRGGCDADGGTGDELSTLVKLAVPYFRTTVLCVQRRAVVSGMEQRVANWARATNRTKSQGRANCYGCRVGSKCCRGRGRCLNGWCACDDGASGPDCAEGRGAESARARGAPRGSVAVYVYELPPQFGFTFGRSTRFIYSAEVCA